MFNENRYVPILKWKQGEQDALRTLYEPLHKKITPLLELPFIEYDYKNCRLKRTPEEHISKLSKDINKKMINTIAYIDFRLLDKSNQSLSSDLAISLFESAYSKGLKLIPVLSPDSSQASYDVAKIFNTNGLCYRLTADYIGNIPRAISEISNKGKKANLQQIDLIIDLGSIFGSNVHVLNLIVESAIKTIPDIYSWRSLVLSSSAFPKDLSDIKRDSISKIPRLEWAIWAELHNKDFKDRMPSFSDYPISHPDVADIDYRVMDRSASIRYSDEENWIIVKGRSIKTKAQRIQNIENSLKLVSLNEYKDADYSWGDSYISNCAKGTCCGSATTWRQVGVNHHMTLVMNQLASFV